MAGTLLVYDEAFRGRAAHWSDPQHAGRRGAARQRYPEPYRLLPIWAASSPDTFFGAIADAAESMGRLNRFIIFGHGRVANAAVPTGVTRVTTGIIIGSSDLNASNTSMLRSLRGRFAREAQAELSVCEAALRASREDGRGDPLPSYRRRAWRSTCRRHRHPAICDRGPA